MKQDPSVVVSPVSGSLGILHLGREAGRDGGGHQLQVKWQRQTIVTFRLAFFILLPSFHFLLALLPQLSLWGVRTSIARTDGSEKDKVGLAAFVALTNTLTDCPRSSCRVKRAYWTGLSTSLSPTQASLSTCSPEVPQPPGVALSSTAWCLTTAFCSSPAGWSLRSSRLSL